jgi:hypothetical protein
MRSMADFFFGVLLAGTVLAEGESPTMRQS